MRFLRFLLSFIMIAVLVPSSHGEMYKWVDEKGTVHFTDDLSNIPEKYLPDAEMRKTPKEIVSPGVKEKVPPLLMPKTSESEGFEVHLLRRGEIVLSSLVVLGNAM